MTRLAISKGTDADRLRALDLFAGLGGWARPLRDRGHDVVTLDVDPSLKADHVRDILSLKSIGELEGNGGRFDVVLASPPCQAFSLLSVWRHWRKEGSDYHALTARARLGVKVMEHTFKLIEGYRPKAWVIENPRGMMRMLAPRKPDITVWYCKLGETRAKPTDLWTNLPVRWPIECKYRNPDCDHERVPRGVRSGTIALKTPALRALIPYGLGLTVAIAAEYALLDRTALDGAGIAPPLKEVA